MKLSRRELKCYICLTECLQIGAFHEKWRCVYKCKLQRLLDETVLTAQDRRQGSREAAADLCFYEKTFIYLFRLHWVLVAA